MKCLLVAVILPLALSAPQPSQDDLSRVYHKLMDRYDKDVRPVPADGKAMELSFGIAPICLEMTPDGILKGSVWGRYIWDDPRLVLPGSKIDNVKVNPSKLWKPDMTLYNRADTWNPQYPTGEEQSNALVYTANGQVLWVPPVYIQARCNTNLDDFWGEQTCTFKFGSWTFNGNEIDLKFYSDKKEVDLTDYADNCPLKVLSSAGEKQVKTYPCCEEPYPSLLFNVTVQRQYVVTEHGILRNPRLPRPH